jgi:hypothetical protein
MTTSSADSTFSDHLYHVLCEATDFLRDKSGATRTVDVIGTYTYLPAAKSAARSCLTTLGYLPLEFALYEEKTDAETWTHGDGVAVYAKAHAGQEFKVRLDTKPNAHDLKGNKEGEVVELLYYVLQTRIDYNSDRVGGIQTTEVEGVHLLRKEAYDAAYTVLLDDAEGITKESYEVYEEQDSYKGEWPYGDDVLVHVVSVHGENFWVTVKEKLKTHQKNEFKEKHSA